MTTFADSSALLKLYVDEEGHEPIRRLGGLVVAHVSRLEVPAALWRKHRLGELTASDARLLTADFEADWFGTDEEPPRFLVVAATAALLDEAVRLCASHGLRASGGVQLASALAARRADETCSSIATFDDALRIAAAAEGFDVMPPAV